MTTPEDNTYELTYGLLGHPARSVESIERDGARPAAARQQAQLEGWMAAHRVQTTLQAMIAADEDDAYAADGFMSANPARLADDLHPTILDNPNRIGGAEWADKQDEQRRAAYFAEPEDGDALARFDDFANHLVAWFRNNGGVPMPELVTMVSIMEREPFDALVEELGVTPYGDGEDKHQFGIDVAAHGFLARVIVSARLQLDERPL